MWGPKKKHELASAHPTQLGASKSLGGTSYTPGYIVCYIHKCTYTHTHTHPTHTLPASETSILVIKSI